MTDDKHAFMAVFRNCLKAFNKLGKAPQINTCLRLIINCKLKISCHKRSNLYSFYLAARKRRINLSVKIIGRTKPHTCKVSRAFIARKLTAVRKAQKLTNCKPFKTRRCLKAVADAELCPFIDRHIRNINSVKKNLARGWLFNAHNQLCKC